MRVDRRFSGRVTSRLTLAMIADGADRISPGEETGPSRRGNRAKTPRIPTHMYGGRQPIFGTGWWYLLLVSRGKGGRGEVYWVLESNQRSKTGA